MKKLIRWIQTSDHKFASDRRWFAKSVNAATFTLAVDNSKFTPRIPLRTYKPREPRRASECKNVTISRNIR